MRGGDEYRKKFTCILLEPFLFYFQTNTSRVEWITCARIVTVVKRCHNNTVNIRQLAELPPENLTFHFICRKEVQFFCRLFMIFSQYPCEISFHSSFVLRNPLYYQKQSDAVFKWQAQRLVASKICAFISCVWFFNYSRYWTQIFKQGSLEVTDLKDVLRFLIREKTVTSQKAINILEKCGCERALHTSLIDDIWVALKKKVTLNFRHNSALLKA